MALDDTVKKLAVGVAANTGVILSSHNYLDTSLWDLPAGVDTAAWLALGAGLAVANVSGVKNLLSKKKSAKGFLKRSSEFIKDKVNYVKTNGTVNSLLHHGAANTAALWGAHTYIDDLVANPGLARSAVMLGLGAGTYTLNKYIVPTVMKGTKTARKKLGDVGNKIMGGVQIAALVATGWMGYDVSPEFISPYTSNGLVAGTCPDHYKPGSQRQIDLFEKAADRANVPKSWARSKDFQELMRRESDGCVGIPNYTILAPNGKEAKKYPGTWSRIHDRLRKKTFKNPNGRKPRSSATGLGQLLRSNAKKYYPSGVEGIGDPFEEAVGMLSYVKDRFGSPRNALKYHRKKGNY
jgi:hypothetical protein